MLIKELSCKTGASIRSIRHYESRGLINSDRSPNGYRNYENDAISLVGNQTAVNCQIDYQIIETPSPNTRGFQLRMAGSL